MTKTSFKFVTLCVFLAFVAFAPQVSKASENAVRIEVKGLASEDPAEVEFLESLVRETILEPFGGNCPYSKLRASYLPERDNFKYVLVLMFLPDVYGAEAARITLLEKEVMAVEFDYQLQPDDSFPPERAPECPDDTLDAFFTCPACSESSGAVSNFQKVVAAAEAAGLNYMYFGDGAPDGPANRQVYYDYWSCENIRYYSNTGHGVSGAIIAEDGQIRSAEMADFDLSCKMMFFTSCDLYRSFEPYIVGDQAMNGGASFYTGGIGPISMGSGDCVFGCFWESVFPQIGSDVDFEAEHASCKSSCNNGDNIGVTAPGPLPWSPECSPDDVVPEVEITSPGDGAIITEGDAVTVTVSATDNVEVAEVDLLVNGTSAGAITTAPYEWDLGVLTVGDHTLKAVAKDTSGNTSESDEFTITVEEQGDDDDDNDNNDDDSSGDDDDDSSGDDDDSSGDDDSGDDDDSSGDDDSGDDDSDDDDDSLTQGDEGCGCSTVGR